MSRVIEWNREAGSMVKHGIDLDSEAVREFCRKWKIKVLATFGSIVREDFRPDSDIDFLVDFDEEADWDLADLADMRDELGAILCRRVDMVTRGGLEHSRNWLFRKIVLSSVETIYAPR